MASIKGSSRVSLMSGDTKYGLNIQITKTSSATANDGQIPSGVDVSSVTAKVFTEGGVDVSTEMISIGATVTDNVVSIGLSYPETTGEGQYSLHLTLTLSSGAVKKVVYSRIHAENY